MLAVYDFGNSVCYQQVRVTMHTKDLDWNSVTVDLFKAEQHNWTTLPPPKLSALEVE